MSSSPSPSTLDRPTLATPIPDDEQAADLPLTMAASVVLTSLPQDAHQALQGAGELEQEKGWCNSHEQKRCLVLKSLTFDPLRKYQCFLEWTIHWSLYWVISVSLVIIFPIPHSSVNNYSALKIYINSINSQYTLSTSGLGASTSSTSLQNLCITAL